MAALQALLNNGNSLMWLTDLLGAIGNEFALGGLPWQHNATVLSSTMHTLANNSSGSHASPSSSTHTAAADVIRCDVHVLHTFAPGTTVALQLSPSQISSLSVSIAIAFMVCVFVLLGIFIGCYGLYKLSAPVNAVITAFTKLGWTTISTFYAGLTVLWRIVTLVFILVAVYVAFRFFGTTGRLLSFLEKASNART